MKKILMLLLLISSQIYGQSTDSTVLSLDNVLKMALSYHPIVKQASLINENATMVLRSARGQLDPKLEARYKLKDFQEKEYYNLLNTTFKVPTKIGIDPKIEFNKNTGKFLNPENTIPDQFDNKQIAIGVNVPLGRGLFFDERRNIIQKAKAFALISEAEQLKATNKILFSIVKDYWSWYLANQKRNLMQQAIGLAQNLFERTLIDYEFGEAAVVDTLQAKINFHKRKADWQKANLEYEVAKLNLSKHLWADDNSVLELRENVVPDSTSVFPAVKDVKSDVEYALSYHPSASKLQGKQQQLDADRKLAIENIKPKLDLSYSLIDAPITPNLNGSSVEFGENYKMGIDFSFPILLRKERGKLQQTRIKLKSNEYEIAQNQLALKNDVLSAYAQNEAFEGLLDQYQQIAQSYQRLLDAEIINLQNGETDLFKLNIQQDKYLEARIAYFESFIKWEKSKASYFHIVGRPLLGLSDLYGGELK